jgi:hypothetical protein
MFPLAFVEEISELIKNDILCAIIRYCIYFSGENYLR